MFEGWMQPGFLFLGEGLFQPMHLLLILLIALVVFGPSKLSQIGKELGQGIRNFKDAMNEGQQAPPTGTEKKDTPPEPPKA